MKQNLDLSIPDWDIFDFHRHPNSNIELFEEDIKTFKISRFCLMPSMLEGDFQDFNLFLNKLESFHKKYKNRAINFSYIDFSISIEENYNHLELRYF